MRIPRLFYLNEEDFDEQSRLIERVTRANSGKLDININQHFFPDVALEGVNEYNYKTDPFGINGFYDWYEDPKDSATKIARRISLFLSIHPDRIYEKAHDINVPSQDEPNQYNILNPLHTYANAAN